MCAPIEIWIYINGIETNLNWSGGIGLKFESVLILMELKFFVFLKSSKTFTKIGESRYEHLLQE